MMETRIGTDRRKRALRLFIAAGDGSYRLLAPTRREDADFKRHFTAADYGLS
jgi:hypothetical protein